MLVHKHLIIRAEVKNPPKDPEWCKHWFRDLAEKIGMEVCAGPIAAYVDTPGNEGVTVVQIISTSHFAMHVWDANDPALVQLDIYTCGPLKTSIIFDELKQFEPVRMDYKYLDREHGLVEIPLD